MTWTVWEIFFFYSLRIWGTSSSSRRRKKFGLVVYDALIETSPQSGASTFPREICGDKCVAPLNASFCGSCCGRYKNSRRRSRPSDVYTDLNYGAPFTLSCSALTRYPRSRRIRNSDGKHSIDKYDSNWLLFSRIAILLLAKRRTRRKLSWNGGNYNKRGLLII